MPNYGLTKTGLVRRKRVLDNPNYEPIFKGLHELIFRYTDPVTTREVRPYLEKLAILAMVEGVTKKRKRDATKIKEIFGSLEKIEQNLSKLEKQFKEKPSWLTYQDKKEQHLLQKANSKP